MTRKSLCACCAVAVVTAAVAAGLVALVRREPAFYRAMRLPEGSERRQHAGEFMAEILRMSESIKEEEEWNCRLTAEQINSYLAEDFGRDDQTGKILPRGVRDPRVQIDGDRLRLAFRYGSPPWSTVVSIDLRLWVTPKEPNTVALELQGMRAGALPISAQSLLESVYEAARQHNIDPSPWYRHRGNPVTLLRFQANRPTPTVRLKRLELRAGELSVSGGPYASAPVSVGAAPASAGDR